MEEGGESDGRQKKISRKLKGKVLMSCVMPAYLLLFDDGGTNRETATEVADL